VFDAKASDRSDNEQLSGQHASASVTSCAKQRDGPGTRDERTVEQRDETNTCDEQHAGKERDETVHDERKSMAPTAPANERKKTTLGILLRERTRSARTHSSRDIIAVEATSPQSCAPSSPRSDGTDEGKEGSEDEGPLPLSKRVVERPNCFVIVSTDWREQFSLQSHPDEDTARGLAATYWCCWVLFAEEHGVMREIKRGGLGMSHQAIRDHIAASCKLLPL